MKTLAKLWQVILLLGLAGVSLGYADKPAIDKVEALAQYQSLMSASTWQRVFFDTGMENWKTHWTLDGQHAWLKNTDQGMVFSAGPEEWNPAHHAVLWTKASFQGDIRIEYNYTRMDTINRWVNILYIQGSGLGQAPYEADLSAWAALRQIPYMKTYFNHMNLIHISYAAYGKEATKMHDDYVRARKYPVPPGGVFAKDTLVPPDYFPQGLVTPGEVYHITVIKSGDELFFNVEGEQENRLFSWQFDEFRLVNKGRIGLRHMWLKSSRYKNFSIYTR